MKTTGHHIRDLVSRVKQRDMLAMKVLYDLFSKSMLTLSFRITKNLEDSEDIIQESFLKSFQEISKLKEPAKYAAWLKRIVVNRSLNTLKRKIHFNAVENIPEPVEVIEDNWYEGISFEKIQSAILELPNGCRQVFTLYLMEGYKHREIAELLDISVSTSKSQYSYALKLLKEILSKSMI